MIFTVAFPVSDLRRIYCPPQTYLERPNWLFPDVGKDFVRAFGSLKRSEQVGHNLGGLKKSAIEAYACDVTNGPKFVDLPIQVENEGKYQWQVLARRLFFDQFAALRLEYDLKIEVLSQSQRIEPSKLLKFIGNSVLQIREHIGPARDGFDQEKFGASGRILAKALLERTVPADGFADIGSASGFVTPERPFVFVHANAGNSIQITQNFIELDSPFSRHFTVFHDRDTVFANSDVPVWLLVSDKGAIQRDVKNFSLYLRRCHSDTEVAKRLLNMAFHKSHALADGEYFSLGEEYEEYVRSLLKRIRVTGKQLRKVKRLAQAANEEQPDLSALASVAYTDTNPGIDSQFEAGLLKMRFAHQRNRQAVTMFYERLLSEAARNKVVIERLNMNNSISNSTISNSNVTQAGGDVMNEISQTFSAASEAVENEDLKLALKDLEAAVQEALKNGEVENPDELAGDVESLTSEVTSEKPRPSRIAAIGGMIRDGVLATSKLVPAIVSSVEKIKSLF